MLRVWTSRDFSGFWVGTAAVVVAGSEEEARRLMVAACDDQGMGAFDGTLQELVLDASQAVVLQNGDY